MTWCFPKLNMKGSATASSHRSITVTTQRKLPLGNIYHLYECSPHLIPPAPGPWLLTLAFLQWVCKLMKGLCSCYWVRTAVQRYSSEGKPVSSSPGVPECQFPTYSWLYDINKALKLSLCVGWVPKFCTTVCEKEWYSWRERRWSLTGKMKSTCRLRTCVVGELWERDAGSPQEASHSLRAWACCGLPLCSVSDQWSSCFLDTMWPLLLYNVSFGLEEMICFLF